MRASILGALLLAWVGESMATPAVTLSGRATVTDIEGWDRSSHPYRTVYFTGEPISVDFTISVDPADQGQIRNLYLAARYKGLWWTYDQGLREWRSWDQEPEHLAVVARKPLAATERLTALNAGYLSPGEYLVYAGYEGEDRDIVFNPVPLGFAVFDSDDPVPVRLSDVDLVRAQLRQATEYPEYARASSYGQIWWEGDIALSPGPAAADAPGVSVSGTNVQETGVDEADRLKSDGVQLLALADCNASVAGCLDRYQIQDQPAANQLVQRLVLPGSGPTSGIYWLRGRPGGAGDLVVTLGSGTAGEFFYSATEVHLFPFAGSALPDEPAHAVSIPGTLMASRVIGEVLYLAVGTPAGGPIWIEAPLVPGAPEPGWQQEQVLPELTLDGRSRPLVQADGCLLPAPYEARPLSRDLAFLVALPLSNPGAFVSRCLLGPIETLFASPRALYLSSARYDSLAGYQWDQRLEIHKYALADGLPSYRGSASLPGHLGWEPDKKSFRFGEHQGILRVATSLNTTDRHRVTLLREDPNRVGRLVETGSVDDLGKPGEQIYAARFLGDRGYLVTFERLDPLYVLDLADPYAPSLAGELEIPGFSDYLHPIGEQWLLGIGTDWVEGGTCSIGTWGSQSGIKLSLFDVADPAAPQQLDTWFVAGGYTNVRDEHLALAYLPPAEGVPARLALPVAVSNRPHVGEQPGWCGFNQAGLYVFDLELEANPGIRQVTSLITEHWPEKEYANLYGNRSLLMPESAHYLHQGTLTSGVLPMR